MTSDTITDPNPNPNPTPSTSGCCISHLFHNAALQSPNKIAIVHARGGARINYSSTTSTDELITTKTTPSVLYEGDECFTYGEIHSAVESLSVRLRRILDGADDPYLIKPQSGKITNEQLADVEIPESSDSSRTTPQMSPKVRDTKIPGVVGIYIEPSVEYIIAVFSVLRCGEAFLPLDPSWPRERILSIIASSKTNLVIGQKESVNGVTFQKLDELSWLLNKCCCPVLPISCKDYIHVECDSLQLVWPCENERLRLFCYLMYTSGSTGRPKGVCGTEEGLLNRFLWMQERYPLHGNEHLLFKTAISFIDHLQEILGALLTTCMLVIPPFSELKRNIYYVVDFLQAYDINRFIAVPSLLRAILPVMRSPQFVKIQSSLKLLVLSGEVFHMTLWEMLAELLPKTAILNLYGSTEVAGDCTYFDCKRLPHILESEILESVPIGVPISNCYIRFGEEACSEGELYVSGSCVASGYFSYPSIIPLDSIKLPEQSSVCCLTSENKENYYFRTGDFARQLQCGDMVFLGRKDRLVKVNGQRVALEEIESILREHPAIVDAAVVSSKGPEETTLLEAHVIKKQNDDYDGILMSSIRTWVLSKLPSAMVPTCIFFKESLPMSSSGKVDYSLLAGFTSVKDKVKNTIEDLPSDHDLIQNIQKVFCDSLMMEKISIYDNFFEMGGNSISAAYAAYKLGINMKMLYTFPTPLQLQIALVRKVPSDSHPTTYPYQSMDTGAPDGSLFHPFTFSNSTPHGNKLHARSLGDFHGEHADNPSKYLKMDAYICSDSKEVSLRQNNLLNSGSMQMSCAFSRCNKVMHGGECEGKRLCQTVSFKEIPRHRRGSMQKLWKVYMESCVDASPLIVVTGSDIYLFIGSHSHRFVSINAKDGSLRWETKLLGRIECSAAILDDFSQVVVGCYQGNIYFLNFLNGDICWSFQTGGEVKSQPVVDKSRQIVWCGSYDHNLYALDYKKHSCIYKVHCGGSIFGSPAIDEVHEKLFVASTSGRITAISLKGLPFCISWVKELESPIFGSLSIDCRNGNVICCSVDGSVLALDTSGSMVWKARTGGPNFAGPCISHSLPSQVLICSRDGSIYSFQLEKGDLLWEHALGQPISSSAFVDEHMNLESDASHLTDRLICVCSSSGSIHVLRIIMNAAGGMSEHVKEMVQEFAKLELNGDIFSSPVMIGGKIFVGCRDDYVHCIGLDE